MGALSDDGRDDAQDPSAEWPPRFVYEAWQDRYAFAGQRSVRTGENLVPRQPTEECQRLVSQLNAMPDRQAAYNIAKAHPWYAENESNRCAVWSV